MKFTLHYDGELRSSGNGSRKSKDKAELRRRFHSQLAELWRIHQVLRNVYPENPVWPAKAFSFRNVDGRSYLPIVTEEKHLACGLKILFLRKEEPGSLVLQGGDIDNRIKTLLDALRMPDIGQTIYENEEPSPLCCLLESDALITSLAVDTGRLLGGKTDSVHEVRLNIDVHVGALQAGPDNDFLLGD